MMTDEEKFIENIREGYPCENLNPRAQDFIAQYDRTLKL